MRYAVESLEVKCHYGDPPFPQTVLEFMAEAAVAVIRLRRLLSTKGKRWSQSRARTISSHCLCQTTLPHPNARSWSTCALTVANPATMFIYNHFRLCMV